MKNHSMYGLSVQWPIKILLVHPQAPFLQREKITIAADCVLLKSNEFLDKYKKGETIIIGCPLLENPDGIMNKLSLVMKETTANKIDVYTMEVPCCHAIHMMMLRAVKENNKENLNMKHYIVRVASGEVEPYKIGVIDESMVEAERIAHDQH
ncbi:MAG: hypothetical protein ACUVTD_05380 [Nitrososphaerales archaeon]